MSSSSWVTAVNVVVAPGEAFGHLREQPKLLFPLVVLVSLTGGVALWYYSAVDIAWLVETQMQQAGMPEGQPPAALESGAVRNVMGVAAAVAAGAGIVLALVVSAGYLAFVSMLTNDGFRFRLWFSLVAWCALPSAFAQLATLVNLLVSDVSRLEPQQLNPLSFSSLLGVDTAEMGTLSRFIMNLNPTTAWALVLLVVGYQSWTRRSLLAAGAIVLGPLLAIVAIAVLLG